MTHPIIQEIEREAMQWADEKRRLPRFDVGDTVKVWLKIKEGERERLQALEGVCIAFRHRGFNSSFTIRKISYGEGVERILPLSSPIISSLEILKRGRVRRAKLYYLRERRGKAARIFEQTSKRATDRDAYWHSRGDSHLREPSLRFGNSPADDRGPDRVRTMAEILHELGALGKVIEGDKAERALSAVLKNFPTHSLSDADTYSDEYQLALAAGDRLATLLFSRDEDIAAKAKQGLTRLSNLLDRNGSRSEEARLRSLFHRLNHVGVMQVSIRREDEAANVTLGVSDIVYAATGKPGLGDGESVSIKVVEDYLDEDEPATLKVLSIGQKHEQSITMKIQHSAERLDRTKLNFLVNGHRVFRLALKGDAERVRLF